MRHPWYRVLWNQWKYRKLRPPWYAQRREVLPNHLDRAINRAARAVGREDLALLWEQQQERMVVAVSTYERLVYGEPLED